MNYFGVRPYPKENESLTGYLLRLAWLNGIVHLERLLTLIGLPRNMSNNAVHWNEEKAQCVLEALAPWLKRAQQQVFPYTEMQMSMPRRFEQYRLVQDLHLSHQRLCLQCLNEQGTLDWRWSLAPVAHCAEHHCLLLDACPSCKAQFKLHSSLLTQCPNCEYEWASHIDSIETLTPLEVSICQALTQPELLNTRDLEALIITIACLARPYDSMIERRYRLPAMMDYSHLVAHAYNILQFPTQQDAWAKSCLKIRSPLNAFGERWVLLPLLNWKDQLQCIRYPLPETCSLSLDDATKISQLREYEAMISKTRRSDSTFSEPRYQFSSYDLETLFDQKTLSSAALRKALLTREDVRLKKRFVNLARLALQLKTLKSTAPSDWIRVDQSTEALSLCLTSYANLLQAVLRFEIAGRLCDLSLTGVWLAPDTFSQWLEIQLRLACSQSIPLHIFKQHFNCDQPTLLIYLDRVRDINDMQTKQYTLVKNLQQRLMSLRGMVNYV